MLLTLSNRKSMIIIISAVILGCLSMLTFFICGSLAGNPDGATDSLKLVIIMHRHGDRTPLSFYGNDPYAYEKKYWPIGLGQLTLKGKQQMFTRGKLLAERYAQFISKYSAQSVRVQSSDSDRCLMSVSALLAALLPPSKDQVWNEDLNWQPIPVHTVPTTFDKLLALHAPCPRYDLENTKILREAKANATESDNKLFHYLTEKTGSSITSYRGVRYLYSILKVEEGNGLSLPEWTKDVYPDKLREMTKLSFAHSTWNTLMKRLKGGPMVDEIIKHFLKKVKDPLDEIKLVIYSGHDTGIVSLWRAFGYEEYIAPDFGATMLFELHEQNKEHYVRMFFLNSTSRTIPYELQIPQCELPCPLDELVNLTSAVRPVDWETECKAP